MEISATFCSENLERFWVRQERFGGRVGGGGGQDGGLLPGAGRPPHLRPQPLQRRHPQRALADRRQPQVGHHWAAQLQMSVRDGLLLFLEIALARFELTDPTALNIVRLITESIQVVHLSRYLNIQAPQ